MNLLRFPSTHDQSVQIPNTMVITINVSLSAGLGEPILHSNTPGKLGVSLYDVNNKKLDLDVTLVSSRQDQRTNVGNYTFVAEFKTKLLAPGLIRVVSKTYDTRGEIIPIRQLHRTFVNA